MGDIKKYLHVLSLSNGILLDGIHVKGVRAYNINHEEGKNIATLTLTMDVCLLDKWKNRDDTSKQAETPDKPGVNAELQVNKVSERYVDCGVRLIKKGRLQAIESSVKSSDANSRVTQSKDVVTVEVD